MIEKIIEKAIKENKPVYIYAHQFPDSDAIGSAKSIIEYLNFFDINCQYIVTRPTYTYSRILGKTYPTKTIIENAISLIVDTRTLEYTENKLFLNTPKEDIFIIDHHLKEGDIPCIEDQLNISKDNVLRNPNASSTCEILAKEFMPEKISPKIATMLTLGLFTGTAKLKHLKQNSLDYLKFLLEKGADYELIMSSYNRKNSLREEVGLAQLFLNIKKISIGNTFGLILLVDNDTVNSLNYEYGIKSVQKKIFKLNDIKNCSFICMIVENNKGEYDIEFRSSSIYGNFNVQKLAATYGGDGHHNAARCHVSNKNNFTKENIYLSIIKYINEFYAPLSQELQESTLNDNDIELSEILKQTNNLTQNLTASILTRVTELIKNGANYEYVFTKFKSLKQFMLANELLTKIPRHTYNPKLPTVDITLNKQDITALTKRYNCTEVEILETLNAFKDINLQSMSIQIPGKRKATIDQDGNISYFSLTKK